MEVSVVVSADDRSLTPLGVTVGVVDLMSEIDDADTDTDTDLEPLQPQLRPRKELLLLFCIIFELIISLRL